MTWLLEGRNLSKRFGGVIALKGINFHVKQGEILGLIGPNGSGKTTLFNLISRIYKPDSGTLFFNGRNITNMKPYEVCKMGISRTFQLIKPFLNQTVLQNVLVGACFGRMNPVKYEEAKEETLNILKELGLIDKKEVLAKNLVTIDRKKLEIARALACKPRLLMLDEPMAGLTAQEVEDFLNIIRGIRQQGITVFLIEHVMKAVMTISDRIMVFHNGEKIAEGSPDEIASCREVINVYLGESYAIT